MNRLIVLGTHNHKKGEELARLVQPMGFRVRTLADYPHPLSVLEDGTTFGENARRKACRQAVHLKAWVLGEDSGLQVDALDGRPGIFSARFAGPSATDAANNAALVGGTGRNPGRAAFGPLRVSHDTVRPHRGRPGRSRRPLPRAHRSGTAGNGRIRIRPAF